jgi:hypothetical protein
MLFENCYIWTAITLDKLWCLPISASLETLQRNKLNINLLNSELYSKCNFQLNELLCRVFNFVHAFRKTSIFGELSLKSLWNKIFFWERKEAFFECLKITVSNSVPLKSSIMKCAFILHPVAYYMNTNKLSCDSYIVGLLSHLFLTERYISTTKSVLSRYYLTHAK